jgi:hypothetical protein
MTDQLKQPRDWKAVIEGGGIAGIIAGIVMLVATMWYFAAQGQGVLTPLYLIAAQWLGVDALLGGIGVVLLGLATHLVLSAIFGIIFAAFTHGPKFVGTALAGGIVWGFFIWLFMTYLVLSWSNPTMSSRLVLMPVWWVLANLMYGCMLAITPVIRQSFVLRHQPHISLPHAA